MKLLLLLLLAVATTTTGCPQQCQCRSSTQGGVIVECRKQDFFQVPEGFPEDTIEIDLGENNIPVLASSTFPRLTKLQKLVMDSCNVRRVENYALLAFPKLQNLTLTNNIISTIAPDALRNLPLLKHIYLENNDLHVLPEALFDNLDLVDLYLSNNHLSKITSRSFQASNIVNLDISHNSFERLPASALLPLRNSLKTFQLSHNEKELSIDPEAFQGFQLDSLLLRNSSLRNSTFLEYVNTRELDISSNIFDSLDFSKYTNLHSVEVLHAENLDIEFLETETLAPFTGLRFLNLAKNKIVLFGAEIFSLMKNLQTLNMEGNSFMTLPNNLGEVLPHLRELYFARCHVMALTEDTFEGMKNLSRLDMRYNKIQVLPESLGPLLESNSSVVDLQGNPFHCNCEMLWFWQLQQTLHHASNYTCNSPKKVAMADLTIEQLQCKEPSIINANPEVTSVVGADVYLTCVAEGDPAPEVEWEAKTGEVLRITPSYNRTMYRTYAIWRLKRVESRRAGKYTCSATNLVGTVKATTVLAVVSSLPSTQVTNATTVSATVSTTPSTTTTSTTTSTTVTTTVTPSTTISTLAVNTTYLNATTGMNFTVLVKSSEAVITTSSDVNLTSTPIADEDTQLTNKTRDKSLAIKIIIVISCTVGLTLLVVCLIFIARQRRHSQKYNVHSNSFDNANREHLTNGLHHKPQETVLPPEGGEEKQKLTQV